MQALYAAEQDKTFTKERLRNLIKDSIRAYYSCYLHSVYYLIKTAEYSLTDAQIQAGKFINKNENVSVRIFHNPVIQSLVLDKSLEDDFRKQKTELRADSSHFRLLYLELKKNEDYIKYSELQSNDLKDDKSMLINLFKEVLMKNEIFTSHMDEVFSNWEDDMDMIQLTMHQTIDKFKPEMTSAVVRISKDYKEEDEFCFELLEQTQIHEAELNEFITPKLKNWELERVALTDVIIMRMALTEWLFFPSIPIKVTINEYIDLAKRYSTPKSGDFVNGVLDNILKDLKKKNLIQKSGRGLIEF